MNELDTLKTIGVGAGGMGITWIEWLPPTVRIAVGIASFVYICVKTIKTVQEIKWGK
tara:strand:+ start:310 stop:480 length:171 start_codon:yes stop_codon:yes gene_type:complete